MSIGVPNKVKSLTKTFNYNDIESLEKILKKEKDKFAAIIMEPVYDKEPKKIFKKC